MADEEEVKEIIRLKMGEEVFVEAAEIAELMVSEMLAGPEIDRDILPGRKLPAVDSIHLNELPAGGLWYEISSFPMIDRVEMMDLQNRFIRASRTLNHEHDLWLADHKPFTLLSHPIISTIMAMESFLECSRILVPHLKVRGLQNVELTRMIECPSGIDTDVVISCQGVIEKPGEALCIAEMKRCSGTEKEAEKRGNRSPFKAEVLLGNDAVPLGKQRIFTTIDDGQEPQSLSGKAIGQHYQERSELTNRYRVLQSISDYRPDSIIGQMIYPEIHDFGREIAASFQYPHYLLEGLMQLAAFLAGLRDPADKRPIVPVSIGQVLFSRNCQAHERLNLYGQLVRETGESLVWNEQGVDEKGQVVMKINDLELRWIG